MLGQYTAAEFSVKEYFIDHNSIRTSILFHSQYTHCMKVMKKVPF